MRTTCVTVLGYALLASACATPSSPSPSSSSSSLAARAQSEQPVALTFAWPEGSEASVEETVLKKGTTAVERYRVRLLPVDGNAEQHDVHIDELHMLQLNGQPVDPVRDAAVLASIERMAALMPRMRIDRRGVLVDVVGMDEMLEAAASTMSEAERGPFLAFMKSAMSQPIMRAASEKIWNTWVGGLVGLQAPPNEDLVAVTEVQGPDGPLRQETHFVLRQAGDHVVVDTNTATPAPVARALLMPVITPMLEAMATKKNAAEATAMLEQIEYSIISSTSTELEPSTMRPHRASSRQVIRIVANGTVDERVEQHDYVFTWK